MKFLGIFRDTVKDFFVTGTLTVATFVSTSLRIGTNGGSSTISTLGKFSVAFTPASVAAASAVEQTVALAGTVVGDVISVSPPGITAGVAPVCARVTVNGTIGITFVNPTAGPLVPSAGNYQVTITR